MSSERRQNKTKKSKITKKEAIDSLALMFPTVERNLINTLLESNGLRMQKTIDALLVLTDDSHPPLEEKHHYNQESYYHEKKRSRS